MLPYPHDLMRLAGLDPVQVFSALQAPGGVNPKTVRNMFEGKHTTRMSTVRRYLESIVSKVVNVGGHTAEADKIQALIGVASEQEGNPYFLAWETLFQGFEFGSQSQAWLLMAEAKQLVELTRSIQPYVEEQDPQGLASVLTESDIPKTDVTRNAIRQLQEANKLSGSLLTSILAQLTLTNILHLIACADSENELLTRLCPLFQEDGVKLPMARWLDGIRSDKSLASDDALGMVLFPHWDPKNAGREVKRWRAGELPAWKTVEKFPGNENNDQLYKVFFIIRVLHAVYSNLEEDGGAEIGIEPRLLFETAPQLQEWAQQRAAILHSSI